MSLDAGWMERKRMGGFFSRFQRETMAVSPQSDFHCSVVKLSLSENFTLRNFYYSSDEH